MSHSTGVDPHGANASTSQPWHSGPSPAGGTMRVYSTKALAMMQNDARQHSRGGQETHNSHQPASARGTRPASSSSGGGFSADRKSSKSIAERAQEAELAARRTRLQALAKQRTEQIRDRIDRGMRHAKLQRERESEERFRNLDETIQGGRDGVVADIRDWQEKQEYMRKQKQAQLADDWEQQVFAPIQRAVKAHVDAKSGAELRKTRNERMTQYLETTNKRDVFGSVVDKGYEPVPDAKEAQVSVPKITLRDPLRRGIVQKAEEDKLMGLEDTMAKLGRSAGPGMGTGPRFPLTVDKWGAQHLEASTFAYSSAAMTNTLDPFSEEGRAHAIRASKRAAVNRKALIGSHYEVLKPEETKVVVAAELPRMGRRTGYQSRDAANPIGGYPESARSYN